MSKNLKVHSNDIEFLAPKKDKSFRLPNGIAVIDFANIAYGVGGLPHSNRNTIMLTEAASEEYINKVSERVFKYIISLPTEIEKVIIFASNHDNDFYKLKVNKNILPFELSIEDEKELGYNRVPNDIIKSCLFYDDTVTEDEYPCTMYPKELLQTLSEIDEEKQSKIMKQADLILHLIKLPKASKHKSSNTWNTYNRKAFCNYMRITDILRIFYVNIIEKTRAKLEAYYSKLEAKKDFEKNFESDSKEEAKLELEKDSVTNSKKTSESEDKEDSKAELEKNSEKEAKSDSKKDSKAEVNENLKEDSKKDTEKHSKHREIIHVSSPLEDDLTMRLFINNLLKQLESDKEYSFYVYSNDRDVISNFADIKNTLWISNYNPFSNEHNEEIVLVDEFWHSLLKDSENHISGFSKRIIYGFLGSDYTTPLMNRYDIRRLSFKDRRNPLETLKKYINRRIIKGSLFELTNEVSDASILEHVKYLASTISDRLYRNLFICSFDSLIGFDSCDFHILTSNSIKYATVKDYLKNEVLMNGVWRFDWNSRDDYYYMPDVKEELLYKTIIIDTRDGIKEITNNYTVIDCKKHKFIKIDSIDSVFNHTKPHIYDSLIKFIKLIINFSEYHSKEVYIRIIQKIIQNATWKYILDENQKRRISKLILIKFLSLYSKTNTIELENEFNKIIEDDDKKEITMKSFEIFRRLKFEHPTNIFTNDEMKEISEDKRYEILMNL